MKKWTEIEITFILKNYNLKGTEFCVTSLNRSKSSVLGMAKKLGLKAKKPNSYSNSEIQFLIDNYSSKGVEYCQKYLHRTKQGICAKAHKLNLFVNKEVKSKNISKKRRLNNYEKYNVDNIININNKYAAYFLGFFWADGHIRNSNSKIISICLVKNDAEFLYKILTSISSGWTIGAEIKKYWKDNNVIKQAQNQRTIRSYSQELYEFLENNNYNNKSNIGFNKIWNLLFDKQKSYFLLGLFDGDGHFNYQYRKNMYHSGEFVISASYNYDWSVLEDFFKKNNIDYVIYNLNVKLGQISRIIIRKKESLIKLYKLLYDGEFVGLERKHIKFLKYYETTL